MTFLIDFGIRSALALGVAFLVALALGRSSASIRYAVWTCALAAALILPAAMLGPSWNLERGVVRVVEQAEPSMLVVVHAQETPSAPAWPRNLPMAMFIAGAIAMLARVAAGHLRLRSLFGKAEPIHDAGWLGIARETAASIGFRRAVRVKRSTATDVPLSYGLIRATVLLPCESDHWTEERRRVVLAHEMIHARRLDSRTTPMG